MSMLVVTYQSEFHDALLSKSMMRVVTGGSTCSNERISRRRIRVSDDACRSLKGCRRTPTRMHGIRRQLRVLNAADATC